ncbi:MAG: TVP38/TMEM64 family protein [Beijerinckiaceae bacterium]
MKRWLPILIIVGAALALYQSGLHVLLSAESLVLSKAWLAELVSKHYSLSILVFIMAYIAIVAMSLPGALLMTLLGGVLFGFSVGAVANILAATSGATLLFLAARSSIGSALRDKGGETVVRMAEGLRKDAASYMLFLRLVPVFPFALVNLAPAIVGVPLKTFFWTTLVGILPGTLAFTFAATSLGGVIDDKRAAFDACVAQNHNFCQISLDLSTLVSPKLLMAFAALGLVALIPVVARRFWTTDKT